MWEKIAKFKKVEGNDKYAQNAMLAGAVVTLLALIIVPAYWPGKPNWWITYGADTGVIGDTIGGIAGPILNFAGLIVVYYSLREQIVANKNQTDQIKNEIERNRNERYFDLTFKLIDKLNDAVEKNAEMFVSLPKANYENDNAKTYAHAPGGKGWQSAYAEELKKYWWALFDLNEYFTMIISQLQLDELTGQQKFVLINLVDITYGRKLKNCRVSYQEYYQNMFEYSEDKKDERPDFLKHIDDRLAEIGEAQDEAKGQELTEAMPVQPTE